MKKLTKVLTILLIVLSLFSSSITVIITGAAPSTYSDTRNSGTRDEVCTTLSGTGASAYYTGSYTYSNLSNLSQSSLLQTLRTLMTSTHDYKSSYNDCKNYADETDCENGNSSIIMIYTSYAGSQSEYNGGNGWNREHVWPKSLGGFETSGAGADLHHIRPSENKTNSNRGNKKYGEVSGGTASIGLSGSTSSVEIVGGSNVSITGNTNGQVVVSATGGTSSGVGFPSYTTPLVEQGDVLSQTNYPGTAYADQSVWLIGNLSVEPDENGQLALSVRVLISHNGNSEAVYLSDFLTQTNSYIDKLEIPVFMPIPAGHTFQIDILQATGSSITSGLAIYPCI